MSTEQPPLPPTVDHNGQTLTLADVNEDGVPVYGNGPRQYVPMDRFDLVRKQANDLKAKLAAMSAAPDPETIRKEVAATYEAQLLEARVQTAVYRFGLSDDDETRGEILDRYSRVRPADDGKKPDLATWLEGQKSARWIKPYLAASSQAVDPATPPAADPTQPPAPPAPRVNVNAGAIHKPPAPTATNILDTYPSMPWHEQQRLKGEYEKALRAAGLIT